MRVGLVMSEYPSAGGHGGLATYTYTLADALASLGHAVTLFQRAGVSTDPLDASVSVRTLHPHPVTGLHARAFRFLFPEIAHERGCSAGLCAALEALRAAEGLDVVQVPEYNGLACGLAGATVPVLVRFHTPAYLVDRLNGVRPSFRRKRWYAHERDALRHARAFTVSSTALKTEICAHYRLDPGRVQVIRNPVDGRLFHPVEEKRSGPVRILFVGRLEKRKGADLLLRCVGALLRKNENMVFTFAGADPGGEAGRYRQALLEAAGPFAGRLEFLGAVARHALPSVYRSADIFVLPSLFDNSPNALFEAQASGLACVGTDTGGVNEMIVHEKTGLLFAPDSPQDFINKIERFLNHSDVRLELGAAARTLVVEKHAPETIARETLEYYQRFTG
ncbi:MAG: glycosyltransferase family 4 protein [Fibrobacterota bacterium]